MAKRRSTSRISLKGQIVYAVELRRWLVAKDGTRELGSLLSYLAISWKDAERFMSDPSQSAGEASSWWFVAPTVIGDPDPVSYTKGRESRCYDLKGEIFKDRKGDLVQPNPQETKARRFQGAKERKVALQTT